MPMLSGSAADVACRHRISYSVRHAVMMILVMAIPQRHFSSTKPRVRPECRDIVGGLLRGGFVLVRRFGEGDYLDRWRRVVLSVCV